MKKPLKGTLVTLGVMVLLPGLLWLDAIRRAVQVIDEQERRLQVEIAAERSRKTCDDVLRGLNASPGPRVLYEQSCEERLQVVVQYWSFIKPQENISDALILDLARTVEAMREAGVAGMQNLVSREHRIFETYKKLLDSRQPSAGELRRVHAALGAIRAVRPTPVDFARSQNLLERTELLRVLRRKEDPAGCVLAPPCWKEFYSWRILIAKSLNQCSDIEAMTRTMLTSSPPAAMDQVRVEDVRLRRLDLHVRSAFQHFLLDATDFVNETDWTMARTATAIRLFQAEKGRDPERLQDLVPEYLPTVPGLSPDGKPLELKRNFVGIWNPDTNPMEVWPVLRK